MGTTKHSPGCECCGGSVGTGCISGLDCNPYIPGFTIEGTIDGVAYSEYLTVDMFLQDIVDAAFGCVSSHTSTYSPAHVVSIPSAPGGQITIGSTRMKVGWSVVSGELRAQVTDSGFFSGLGIAEGIFEITTGQVMTFPDACTNISLNPNVVTAGIAWFAILPEPVVTCTVTIN